LITPSLIKNTNDNNNNNTHTNNNMLFLYIELLEWLIVCVLYEIIIKMCEKHFSDFVSYHHITMHNTNKTIRVSK